jgi:hypothetical protein
MTVRVVDKTERVVIAKPERTQRLPMLAFQHAQVPAYRDTLGRRSTWVVIELQPKTCATSVTGIRVFQAAAL